MRRLTFFDDCRRFANARASAVQDMRGATFQEALKNGYRWFPRLAGENFKPSSPNGFATRQEAIANAKAIREQCRLALREQDDG